MTEKNAALIALNIFNVLNWKILIARVALTAAQPMWIRGKTDVVTIRVYLTVSASMKNRQLYVDALGMRHGNKITCKRNLRNSTPKTYDLHLYYKFVRIICCY